MGVAQCVGKLVDTTRIYAAATPVAGSGEEAHTKRDDASVLQGLWGGVPCRQKRERRVRLGDDGGRWRRGDGGGVFERDADVHVANVQAVEQGEDVDRRFLGERRPGRPVFASWADDVVKG